MSWKKVAYLALSVFFSSVLVSCLSGSRVVKMVTYAPAEAGGNRQEKSGVIMEVLPIDEQALSENRFPEVKVEYTANYSKYSARLFRDNLSYRVKVTNSTGHVLKFTGAVVKLTDEVGNMYDALSKNDCIALHPADAAWYAPATAALRKLKYLDANTEILPDMTWDGYVAFNVTGEETGELVKFAVYDLVTKTDEAGVPKEKSRFEFNFKKAIVESGPKKG